MSHLSTARAFKGPNEAVYYQQSRLQLATEFWSFKNAKGLLPSISCDW